MLQKCVASHYQTYGGSHAPFPVYGARRTVGFQADTAVGGVIWALEISDNDILTDKISAGIAGADADFFKLSGKPLPGTTNTFEYAVTTSKAMNSTVQREYEILVSLHECEPKLLKPHLGDRGR